MWVHKLYQKVLIAQILEELSNALKPVMQAHS